MDFVVYQMRKLGIVVKKELLGDQPQLIGDLVITAADARGRPTKVARLQKENGAILLELLEAQVDPFKAHAWYSRGESTNKQTRGRRNTRSSGYVSRLVHRSR